ncbi:MAG: DNA methyltransferase [Phycisphaerales bacterium]
MTTATSNPTSITEARFNKLMAKLRELFELDKADLDFGIYRIMAAKNKEVTEFLDRQLRDVVAQTLAEHGAGAGAGAALDEQIARARRAAADAGFDPDQSPKVRELEAHRASAGETSEKELEAHVYNHLLAFFGRYYDEGDFISQRRYKGDTYAIPYSGEEVTLHWANKDQYYIKSGEWHKDYRFVLPAGRDGKVRRVRFALVEATQEAGNNKERDEAKRRYILVDENPVVVSSESGGETLTLRFQFRAPTESEKARADDDAVAIFGGKYEKSTKGDERERFCADAEKRAIPHIPDAWAAGVLAASPTEAKPRRTLLGKHLDAFTARNTFDYFIHKDLGGFLRRELDFYIKNEVVRLDDLETLPGDHLQRVQGRVRAIRRVASKVIELLAAIEDFQKKLWLKKKFVLGTSWLVTVDRMPEALRDVVAKNKQQWAEWERLGFKPDRDTAGELFGKAKWGTRAYLDACDKLVVDTRLFDEAFTAELLASEEVLGGASALDDAVSGTLANSDNFHAVRLILPSLSHDIACVYLDPPYNAKSSEILYKNTFKHSSWMTLIGDRVQESCRHLAPATNWVMAIDEVEQERLGFLLRQVFPSREVTAVTVVHNATGQQGNNFSATHEYAYFVHDSKAGSIGLQARDENPDVRPLRNVSKGSHLRTDAKNCFYPIFVKDGEIIGFGDVSDDDYHPPGRNVERDDGVIEVYPVNKLDDDSLEERKWTFAWATVPTIRHELTAEYDEDTGTWDIIRRKVRFNFKTVWADKKYSANSWGSVILNQMLPENDFTFPKSVFTVQDCVDAAMGNRKSGIVLDYFAGSGTTGHSVANLNRLDGGTRRFALIEMGGYYDRVLVPRVKKALYSSSWREGQAQEHADGQSALVKCFTVESYEDALNNLPAPSGGMFDGRPVAEADAWIRYALDLELGPRLLDLDIFRDPWGHTINAQLAGDDEIRRHRVDLVETFNYLLGLRVSAYGPIERYHAPPSAFERAEHEDGLGRLKLKGRPRREAGGDGAAPFVFQRVEGVLNPALDGGNETRVLVVWRTLTDDPEKDAAMLDWWMARHGEKTTERSEHREYHQIYINGPVTLAQPTAEIRTVWPIEEAFKRKMFEDAEGGS